MCDDDGYNQPCISSGPTTIPCVDSSKTCQPDATTGDESCQAPACTDTCAVGTCVDGHCRARATAAKRGEYANVMALRMSGLDAIALE